jgi:APA family basic amino acid/polyamine antiporter
MGGVLFCGTMAARLGPGTWYRLVGWTAVGLVVYFLYSRHHSRLREAAHPPAR